MSKKLVMILAGLLVYLLLVHSIACHEDQVIFRISDFSNAHAALYDYLDYEIEICYTNLTQGLKEGAPGDRSSCSSPLLKLSDVSNAHVAPGDDPIDYTVDLCYGDVTF